MTFRCTIDDLAAEDIKDSESGSIVTKSGTNITKSGKKLLKKWPGANALTKGCLYLMNSRDYEVWLNNDAGVWDPQKKIFRKESTKRGAECHRVSPKDRLGGLY